MRKLGIGYELTLLVEGFVGSFEVCTVVTDNSDVDDSMCCLDDKLLSGSLSPKVYSSSIERFNCEDCDDSNFFLEDKFMIESLIAAAASVISGRLSRGDDETRYCLDKDLACDSTEFVTA